MRLDACSQLAGSWLHHHRGPVLPWLLVRFPPVPILGDCQRPTHAGIGNAGRAKKSAIAQTHRRIQHAQTYGMGSGVVWQGNSRHLLCSGSQMPLQLIPTQRPFREMVRFAEKPRNSSFGAFLFSGCCTQSAANHVPLFASIITPPAPHQALFLRLVELVNQTKPRFPRVVGSLYRRLSGTLAQ